MAAKPAFLIALTGGSGSGKSTLADALLKRLASPGACLFHEDGYYWPMAHFGDAKSEAERDAIAKTVNYDDPITKETQLMAAHLAALKAGNAIEQPVYDFERHDRERHRTHRIDPAPIILLEGIHALSVPEIMPLIDLSIYVDTPDDLRLARRIRRDVLERKRTLESVLSQYLGSVRAAHYRHTYPAMFEADLVIADEGLPAYGQVCAGERAIERMLAPILSRLETLGVI